MTKHFPIERTAIAVHELAPRGVTVRASKAQTSSGRPELHLLLHNGCGRGNMIAVLTNQQAIDLAIELIRTARP